MKRNSSNGHQDDKDDDLCAALCWPAIRWLWGVYSVIVTIYLMIVWSFSSHSKIFHSFGDVTIAGEGLHILTYVQHSWPLSSEGSLACHTYWEMGHPFIIINSHLQGPVTLAPNAEPVLRTCGSWDLNTQPFACRGNAITHCTTIAD